MVWTGGSATYPRAEDHGYTALLRTNKTRSTRSRTSCSLRACVRTTCVVHARSAKRTARTCAGARRTHEDCVQRRQASIPAGVVQRFWRSIGVYPLFVGCLLWTVCVVLLFCFPLARVAFFTQCSSGAIFVPEVGSSVIWE